MIRTAVLAALALVPMAALAEGQGTVSGDIRDGVTVAYDRVKGTAVDGYIAGRLVTAYALSEHLSPLDVQLTVENRVVKLRGTVQNGIQRDLAIEIARGIEEVEDVQSEIQVKPESRGAVSQVSDRFTRRFNDATVTARVKTRLLMNRSTSGLSINVDTENQVVTLSGTVGSPAEAALAEQIALNTKGVRKVENGLTAEPVKG